jgi:hypothetical protein
MQQAMPWLLQQAMPCLLQQAMIVSDMIMYT